MKKAKLNFSENVHFSSLVVSLYYDKLHKRWDQLKATMSFSKGLIYFGK